MKKLMIGLTALMLMLSGLVCAWAEEAPVLLVQLPEDAQMVGERAPLTTEILFRRISSTAVRMCSARYGDMSISIGDLVAGDWAGATSVQDMGAGSIGGCTAKRCSPEL